MDKKLPYIPEYKIAFTFTGEYRESIVRPVCEELLKLGYSKDEIFFDEWYPALFTGVNADSIFRKIYHDMSKSIVVLLSPNYGEKLWTGNLEWPTVRALINEGTEHKICLLSVDNVDINTIEGLFSTRDVARRVDGSSASLIAEFIHTWYYYHIMRQPPPSPSLVNPIPHNKTNSNTNGKKLGTNGKATGKHPASDQGKSRKRTKQIFNDVGPVRGLLSLNNSYVGQKTQLDKKHYPNDIESTGLEPLVVLQKQILPLDERKPFVFISYRSNNGETSLCSPVYRDIIFLQKKYPGLGFSVDITSLDDDPELSFRYHINHKNCIGAIIYLSPDYITPYRNGHLIPHTEDKCFMEASMILQRSIAPNSTNHFFVFPVFLPNTLMGSMYDASLTAIDFVRESLAHLQKESNIRFSTYLNLFDIAIDFLFPRHIILTWDQSGAHFENSMHFQYALSQSTYASGDTT